MKIYCTLIDNKSTRIGGEKSSQNVKKHNNFSIGCLDLATFLRLSDVKGFIRIEVFQQE